MKYIVLIPLLAMLTTLFTWVYIFAQGRRNMVNYTYLLYGAAGILTQLVAIFLCLPFGIDYQFGCWMFSLMFAILFLQTLIIATFIYFFIDRPFDRWYGVLAGIVLLSIGVTLGSPGVVAGYMVGPGGGIPLMGPLYTVGIMPVYMAMCVYLLGLVYRRWRACTRVEQKVQYRYFLTGTGVTIALTFIFSAITFSAQQQAYLWLINFAASIFYAVYIFLTVSRYNLIAIDIQQVQKVCDHLFDGARDALLTIDRTGRLVQANRAAEEILNLRSQPDILILLRGIFPDYDSAAEYHNHLVTIGPEGQPRQLLFSQTRLQGQGAPLLLLTFKDISDLKSIERELRESEHTIVLQNNHNNLRAQIWQLAADPALSETELIQRLLNTVGPALGVSRACYNRFQDDRIVCLQEWCAPGICPSLNSHMPAWLFHQFMDDGPLEISVDSVKTILPAPLQLAAMPLITAFADSLDIHAVYAVTYQVEKKAEGTVTFDICRSQMVRPQWTAERKKLAAEVVQIIAQNITQRRMEARLKQAKDDLEVRVHERTAELQSVNVRLVAEISERVTAEGKLAGTLREKDVLLKEVHHRVKNNLQTISSLLSLQGRYIQDPAAQEMFKDTQSRVKSIALVHEKLYQSADLAHIDFTEYLRKLSVELFRAYGADPGRINLAVEGESIFLTIEKAIPASLITNEIISNTFKYAFPEGRGGNVNIKVALLDPGLLRLTVSDDGVGLPPDFVLENALSLGLQLVRTLSDQLEGKLEVGREQGTHYTLEFKTEE